LVCGGTGVAFLGAGRIGGMKDKRAPAIIAVSALLLIALLAAYLGGYFLLGEYEETPGLSGQTVLVTRGYQSKLACDVYKPVAWIEQNLRGFAVHTWWTSDPDPFD